MQLQHRRNTKIDQNEVEEGRGEKGFKSGF